MDKSKLNFEDIYSEFNEKISRYLQQMVGKNDAEDVTQEVFLKINKSLHSFDGKSSLSTWVYRIATNTAFDKLRSRSSCQEKVSLDTADDESLCIKEKSLSAEREVIRNEMTECIREFIDRLPIDYRTIIILSEIKDLKNQEIADILGISLDTVKIRLHRSRLRLKAEFEAGCFFYQDED
jgi:RNA polymerase sigma-70 factor, ECF subfamily